MEIKFVKLDMVNFKGTRKRTIEFSKNVTVIQGRNKIGKTTVADACWWVLFGKDSQGNTNFGIKTNGEDMRPIPKLDHIVSLTMTVDGSEITLTRKYEEDWTKRRGGDEELTGHHMVSLINGSKVKESEYKDYIDSLCNEGLFKVLSKSEVFFTLKPDAQRALLVKMVGEKTPGQFVAEHPEFEDVFKAMGVLDFDTYMSGITYKIKEVDKQITDSVSRIKEQKTELETIKSKHDYGAIRETIATKDAELKSLQEQLAKPSEIEKAKAEKAKEISGNITEAMKKRDEVYNAIREAVSQAHTTHMEKVADANKCLMDANAKVDAYIRQQRSDVTGDIQTLEKEIAQIDTQVRYNAGAKNDTRNANIKTMMDTIKNQESLIMFIKTNINMDAEWEKAMDDKVVSFREAWKMNEDLRDDISTVCPTCHQPLPESKVAEIKEEAERKYQENRALLMARSEDIKKAQEEGKARSEKNKNDLVEAEAKMESLKYELENLEKVELVNAGDILKNDERYQYLLSRLNIKKGMLHSSDVALDTDATLVGLKESAKNEAHRLETIKAETIPTIEEKIRQSEEYASISAEIAKLNAQRDELSTEGDEQKMIDGIKARIEIVSNERDALVQSLGTEKFCKDKEDRIHQLEVQHDNLQAQKAELQGQREMAKDYQMAIIEDLESRVNALFEGIQFRMFDQKLNGNIESCCKCYIGVTEYKDGSHAERINAGLEMIDTMAKYNNVYVPCFVDDAEGINHVYETKAQQIRMAVTMENEMQIIHM